MQQHRTTTSTVTESDFTRTRQLVDDLERAVHALEVRFGHGLEVRRVRADLDHLRESVGLLVEATLAGRGPAPAGPGGPMVQISDAPYDPSLWRDAGDEGIGSR